MFCFIEIGYLVLVRPYEVCVVNILSVLNEVLYFVSIFIYMWFQHSSRVSAQVNLFMGWMATTLMLFMIVSNMALIVPLTIYTFVKQCRKKYSKQVHPDLAESPSPS